ncbi:hypothetical protein BOTCAL_0031g00090 [Botryotinia calthae]|uniref:Uncharacterized protein n=1 Tax=Botryotinia calthae TaxID=38488 RepID=A0A4Y8DG03_9HELO|nr:hypothetical protein BOTCAL_0031g00090 [Botryotinia calthae]
MESFEDIWGEMKFLNLPTEDLLVLPEDNTKEDEELSMIYKKDQPSDKIYFSYGRKQRGQEIEARSAVPIVTEVEKSIGKVQCSNQTSLSLAQYPTIASSGMPPRYEQNISTCETSSPPSNIFTDTIRQPAVLDRSSSLSFSVSSDRDNKYEYKYRKKLPSSTIKSRPSYPRREKNSIDKIIEEYHKKHAGKLGVGHANSKPLTSEVIQKKPTRRKGHKYSRSWEEHVVECQDQHSGSRTSEIHQGYRFNFDEQAQFQKFEEEDSFQQMGQVGQIPPKSTYSQHMGQLMVNPFTQEVQQFNYNYQSLPPPPRISTQQPSLSFQQLGHTYYDWSSYPFNYTSVLDEPHSPLFPERNLWVPRATETLPDQLYYQFQMPAVQTQDFETQQNTTVEDGNHATALTSTLMESFGSERRSGQSPESSWTSPSFSPYQAQTDYTHRPENIQGWER